MNRQMRTTLLMVPLVAALAGCQMTNWSQHGYGSTSDYSTVPESSLGAPVELGEASKNFSLDDNQIASPHTTVRPESPAQPPAVVRKSIPALRGPIALGEPTSQVPAEYFEEELPNRRSFPLTETKPPSQIQTEIRKPSEPEDAESFSSPAELALPETLAKPVLPNNDVPELGPDLPLFGSTKSPRVAGDFTVVTTEILPVGETSTLRLTVQNQSDEPADDWLLKFTFPDGIEPADASSSSTLLSVPKLGAGSEKALSYDIVANQAGSWRFEVRLMRGETELAWREITVKSEQQPLLVRLLGPDSKPVDGRAEFTVRVENRSSESIGPLNAALEFDATLIPVEASEGAEQKPGRLNWQFPALHPGEILFLQAEFSCPTTTENSCLVASVSAGDDAPAIVRKSCLSVVAPRGTLRVEVLDEQDLARTGEELTAVVRVTNLGLQPARQVRVVLPLSDHLEFQSHTLERGRETLPVGTQVVERELHFDPVGELAADATLEYRIVFRTVAEGDDLFRVRVTDQLHVKGLSVTEPFTVTP